jgi:hypothetical protein
MSDDTVQVKLDGDLLTVRADDVVYDADGNAIAVRPRGYGLGSEGDYAEADLPPSAEHKPSGA